MDGNIIIAICFSVLVFFVLSACIFYFWFRRRTTREIAKSNFKRRLMLDRIDHGHQPDAERGPGHGYLNWDNPPRYTHYGWVRSKRIREYSDDYELARRDGGNKLHTIALSGIRGGGYPSPRPRYARARRRSVSRHPRYQNPRSQGQSESQHSNWDRQIRKQTRKQKKAASRPMSRQEQSQHNSHRNTPAGSNRSNGGNSKFNGNANSRAGSGNEPEAWNEEDANRNEEHNKETGRWDASNNGQDQAPQDNALNFSWESHAQDDERNAGKKGSQRASAAPSVARGSQPEANNFAHTCWD